MGTTLACAVIRGADALVFNIGDSKVYHLSAKSGLKQVTKDHSKIQLLVDKGLITEEGAKNHPEKSVITRVLGCGIEKGTIEPDIYSLSISPGDQLLICSDGLTDMVETDKLSAVMMLNSSDLGGNAETMLHSALRNGGHDNITLILIQIRSNDIEEETEEDMSTIISKNIDTEFVEEETAVDIIHEEENGMNGMSQPYREKE